MDEVLGRDIIELLLDRKLFYGHFLQQFKHHYVDRGSPLFHVIKTLSVSINDDLKPNLFINTAFYNAGDYDPQKPHAHTWGLTQDERIALLEHEIMHLLNKHIIRNEGRDDYVWTLAADLACNQYIKNLPHGARCPECGIFVRLIGGKVFPTECPLCKTALDVNIHKAEPLEIETFTVNNKKINFDRNMPTESYFDTLWKTMPKSMIQMGGNMFGNQQKNAKDQMKNQDGQGQGQGQQPQGQGDQQQEGQGGGGDQQNKDQQQQGQGGEGQGGGNQNQQQPDGGGGGQQPQQQQTSGSELGSGMLNVNGQQMPMPMDQHEAWATGSDNKEMAHEKIKDMTQKAVHKVNEKSQGYLPDHIRNLVEAVLAHKTVNWKSELRKFVGYEEFACFESSRKRISRRYPMVQPGNIVKRKAHFVVAADSSGSVSDEEFGKFWKEIAIMNSAGISITYVEIDADIQKVEKFKKKPAHEVKRRGYGGTSFVPVFDFVEKKKTKNHNGEEFIIKGKVDGIIYLTDGYGTFPKKVPCPTIWVMTPNHGTNGWTEKIGKIIVMDKD